MSIANVKATISSPELAAADEARIQTQIAADPDNPEITDEQAAQLRPFEQAFPQLHGLWKRGRGRPKAEITKVPVKLRLDPDVVEGFRATGPGWQTRISDVLRASLAADPAQRSGHDETAS